MGLNSRENAIGESIKIKARWVLRGFQDLQKDLSGIRGQIHADQGRQPGASDRCGHGLFGILEEDHKEIVRSQDAALDRLLARDFAGLLLDFVDQVGRTPRPPRTEVRWDFWQRFAEWERLEELRLFRPSAYQALPFAPGERGENP